MGCTAAYWRAVDARFEGCQAGQLKVKMGAQTEAEACHNAMLIEEARCINYDHYDQCSVFKHVDVAYKNSCA